MSDGDVRKVSVQDIQLVQNLIERCLQLYMSQREVVNTLLLHAKIEPGFTELVWQKLETENSDFFRAYYLRLIVKDQILLFNQLLQRQVELSNIYPTGVSSMPQCNESQTHPMHSNSAYQAPHPVGPSIKPENLHQDIRTIPNAYTNGASSMQPQMQVVVNMGAHLGRINVPETGMIQGMNGGVIKSESGYTDGSPYIFGADNNLLETRHAITGATVSSFNGGESSSQVLNEPMLEQEMNSFGYLGKIPRNFSLSDLTADFSNSTDILDSYSGSPFLGTDVNFLDPQIREEQQEDTRRLDTISEGFSYEDFVSD